MGNILVVLIFIFLKMFHGKKIAGILHHSLVFLSLVCVGLPCVVLFFSCKEGLGIRTRTHFEISFLCLTALHCVFTFTVQGRAHRAVEGETKVPHVGTRAASTQQCPCQGGGLQEEESRDPG